MIDILLEGKVKINSGISMREAGFEPAISSL